MHLSGKLFYLLVLFVLFCSNGAWCMDSESFFDPQKRSRRGIWIVPATEKHYNIIASFNASKDFLHEGHRPVLNEIKKFLDKNFKVTFIIGIESAVILSYNRSRETQSRFLETATQNANSIIREIQQYLNLGPENDVEFINDTGIFSGMSCNDFLKFASFEQPLSVLNGLSAFDFLCSSLGQINLDDLYPHVEAMNYKIADQADPDKISIIVGGENQIININRGLAICDYSTAYILPLVFGEDGNKMGESNGNTVPLFH